MIWSIIPSKQHVGWTTKTFTATSSSEKLISKCPWRLAHNYSLTPIF
jgi:hypothetical protein